MPFDMEPFVTKVLAEQEEVEETPMRAVEALLWVVVLLLLACSPAITIAVWSWAL